MEVPQYNPNKTVTLRDEQYEKLMLSNDFLMNVASKALAEGPMTRIPDLFEMFK